MTKTMLVAALLLATPVTEQLGQLDKLRKAADKVADMHFTDSEERQLGADISAQLREKYGVVQDRNVHKYVTLVGSVLASSSSRPALQWTFIVLDTDGVNAFATPGGYIHITRGALALIQNEGELATVLGHEIGHVTEKHTIDAITKSKGVDTVAGSTPSGISEESRQQGLRDDRRKRLGSRRRDWRRQGGTGPGEQGRLLAGGHGRVPGQVVRAQ